MVSRRYVDTIRDAILTHKRLHESAQSTASLIARNKEVENRKTKKSKKADMLRSIGEQSGEKREGEAKS